MRCDAVWLCQNLTTNNVFLLNTTEKDTNVITSHTLIKSLLEHFDTCYSCISCWTDTYDLYWVVHIYNTAFDLTCYYSTTTRNCEDIFDWHQEWFIRITNWIIEPCIHSLKKFFDTSCIFSCSAFLKSFECRTLNDWCISREAIRLKSVFYFFNNQFKKIWIVNQVNFVQEYDNLWYTYLTSKQQVLFCLRHN